MNLSKLQKTKLFGVFSVAISFLMMIFSVPVTAAKAHAAENIPSQASQSASSQPQLQASQPQSQALQPQSQFIDTVAMHEASLEAYQQYQQDGEDRFIKGDPDVSTYFEGDNYVVKRSYNDGIGTFTETTVTAPSEATNQAAANTRSVPPKWPLNNPYQIPFTTYVKTAYSLNGGYFPSYYTQNKPCETAAATILGYHDRVHTNLIPNQEPGYIQSNGNYEYYSKNNIAGYASIVSSLTTAMNNNGNALTVANWKSGLASYAQTRGKTVTYTDIFDYTYNSVGLPEVKYHLQNNGPMAFFFNGFYRTSTFINNDKMFIHRSYATGQNVFVVYGYEQYLFYVNGGLKEANWFVIFSDPILGARGMEHHVMGPEYVAPTILSAYGIKFQ